MNGWHAVRTSDELLDALARGRPEIEVHGTVAGVPPTTLPPGTRLRGGTIVTPAAGLRLTRDNELADVAVHAPAHEVAVDNDTSVDDLGVLSLRGVRTTGRVALTAADAVRRGHVDVRGLHVLAADVRTSGPRPRLVGVDALPGACTVWNRQPDPAVVVTAELRDIAAGTAAAAIRGSGVLVGGYGLPDGTRGGTLRITALTTGEVHVDGGIPAGTPDLIAGGVLVIPSAVVEEVVAEGAVTTRGANDMVLDNSGEVRTWTARAPLTSHGPSGVGFVNFGTIDRLDVRGPVRTYGTGARGFNFYTGHLRHASFADIATHGDGSVGVQITRPLPVLEVAGDLTTAGGAGRSLVKGVQVVLAATALSVPDGGHVGRLAVGGRIRTSGDGVPSVEIEGRVDRLTVDGGISAEGRGADAVRLRGAHPDLDGIAIRAVDGRPVVVLP